MQFLKLKAEYNCKQKWYEWLIVIYTGIRVEEMGGRKWKVRSKISRRARQTRWISEDLAE